ncbi:MAG: hypothetical protein A2857_00665 [Candidatus Levybacteria bacterium RIFCSPHIGHO2_01_FULL_36_15]|nr:MAG: hypothetical protein A2857_00665 [Candidatus Levybacteria bacterium RIFCSPHIGHO2_01_FULL_36_15]OGH39235.1 MAG: hypothetical protein A2905_01650 [Candidatus Levybacteria bacterium RIFCSPLOWO2_01_FULL_36_10]
MKRKRKKTILPMLLVLLFSSCLVLILFYLKENIIASKQSIAYSRVPKIMPMPVNFTETGYITDFDSKWEKKTGNWVFLYENPGIPVIRVNLEFTNESKCDLGEGLKLCKKTQLIEGERIRIEGLMRVDKLIVSLITKAR